jgi:hypothetical protein
MDGLTAINSEHAIAAVRDGAADRRLARPAGNQLGIFLKRRLSDVGNVGQGFERRVSGSPVGKVNRRELKAAAAE